jgi:hypothetical protein
MSTVLWKDLITIPERPSEGDFVLKLTEGVNAPQATSSTYVVTRGLKEAFDQAVGLVAKAIKGRSSDAAYLHGSFGAGKSHFMAMLHLILNGHDAVKNRDDFFELFEKYSEFRSGKDRRVLSVHLHMLDSHSTESSVFAGYIRRVRDLHPDAPLPDLLGLAPIVSNGERLRAQMGDDGFFAALSPPDAAGTGTKFGRVNQAQGIAPAARWDAARFDAAVAAGPGHDEYKALARQLLRTLLTGMADLASRATHASTDSWVPFEQGLAAMSEHAQTLGYDAIVLFLDEHILWLAGLLSDTDRVAEELSKLPKLVESGVGPRPVPIVSFVARQYELAEFARDGSAMYGSDLSRIDEGLKHHGSRLKTITLPSTDLPQIISKRLLEPRGPDPDAQRAQIHDAFDRFVQSLSPTDRQLIATNRVDNETMRRTWPFAPVLVEAMVRLSEKLQRDRTALKLLTFLLCRHRDDLELGKIVPMGDLWQELASGDEPHDATSKSVLHRARALYENKLRPALLQRHSMVDDDLHAPAPSDEVRRRLNGFRRDDLLVCTVLVASLLPDWEVTRTLDLQKLHAFNLGAVGGGRFAGTQLTVVKETMEYLTRQFDEVVLVPAAEPGQSDRVRLRLEGVDLSPILNEAERYATKTRLEAETRRLVFAAMGLSTGGNSQLHKVDWRAREVHATVQFENVRAVPEERDDLFMTNGDTLKLVLDYPFDDPGFASKADLDRLDAFRQRHPSDTNAVVWLPRFLNDSGFRLLKDYVVTAAAVEYAETLTSNLDEDSRKQARGLLESRSAQLRSQTLSMLTAAFDLVRDKHQDQLSADHADVPVFNPLHRGMKLRTPNVSDFANALPAVCNEMLVAIFPAAPKALRPKPLKSAERTLLAECLFAGFASGEPSFAINKEHLTLLGQVAQPLGLGVVHEKELRFEVDSAFEAPLRAAHAEAGERLTVQHLREALDPPAARTGLPRELCDVLIVCWALRNSMEFYDGTQRRDDIDAKALPLSPTLRLLHTALPDEAVWNRARQHAQQVFGVSAHDCLYRSARSMRLLAGHVRTRIEQNEAARRLPTLLTTWAETLEVPADAVNQAVRVRHARQVADLVKKLATLQDLDLVQELGRQSIDNPGVLKATFERAEAFAEALEDTEPMKDVVFASRARAESPAAQGIYDAFVHQLLHGAAHDFSGATLRDIQRDAKEWLRQRSISAPIPAPAPAPDTMTLVNQALSSADDPTARAAGATPDAAQPVVAWSAASPLTAADGASPAEGSGAALGDPGANVPGASPAPGMRRQRVRSSSDLDALLGQLSQALASARALVIDWSVDEDA